MLKIPINRLITDYLYRLFIVSGKFSLTNTGIHTDYQILTEADTDTDYTNTDIWNIWTD